MDHKPISVTHLSCGCDWNGKRWKYCAQHERPDAAPPKKVQRMAKCEDCQVWHRPDEPCPIHEAKDVTEMCWYDRDSQTLGFMVDDERCYVKMERFLHPEDAPGGPWEELKKAGTLYISALKYLVEGYRGNDGWERIMAKRDSVAVQEERWCNALNRLKGDEK